MVFRKSGVTGDIVGAFGALDCGVLEFKVALTAGLVNLSLETGLLLLLIAAAIILRASTHFVKRTQIKDDLMTIVTIATIGHGDMVTW